MYRRIRFLAALLALMGFTAYVAESLVTSSCLPGMPAMAGMAATPDSHDGMHHPAPAPAESDTETSHCPLGMVGGNACVVAVLPPPTSAARLPGAELVKNASATADAPHELFVRTLFHPPRV